jgi:hypothetical protein
MTRITIDAKLAETLRQHGTGAELCDEEGNTVGRFVPELDLAEWEPASPGISEEELHRRANSNEKGITTAELIARLERL